MEAIKQAHSWVNEEFLTDVLLRASEHCPKIINFTLEPAIGKGENFSSELLRANINYTRDNNSDKKSKSIILKIDLSNAEHQDSLNDFNVFTREKVFFDEIVPRIEKILVDTKIKIAPTCYKTLSRPNCLVFEDLKALGYENEDRKVGLSLTQAKLTLEKLAVYHAATAVLYNNDPTIYRNHNIKALDPDNEYFRPLFVNAIMGCAAVIPEYKAKLELFSEFAVKKGSTAFENRENAFKVLNQGDLWINNVMFRNGIDGVAEDVLLVDFQLGFYGSPGVDLSYFLYSSLANDTTEKDWIPLLTVYQSTLDKYLTQFGYIGKIPSLADIQLEMKIAGMYGVVLSFITNLIRQIEDVAGADMSSLIGQTDEAVKIRETWHSSKRYQERMEFLLNYYNREGFLDAV